jgi:hypothetical protein
VIVALVPAGRGHSGDEAERIQQESEEREAEEGASH